MNIPDFSVYTALEFNYIDGTDGHFYVVFKLFGSTYGARYDSALHAFFMGPQERLSRTYVIEENDVIRGRSVAYHYIINFILTVVIEFIEWYFKVPPLITSVSYDPELGLKSDY